MGIPESQLDTWAHQGSISQSSDTYATTKRALEAPGSGYSGKDYAVFLQGSYGNDTNIYAESDVDIVIRLAFIYYYDIDGLSLAEKAAFNGTLNPPSYTYDMFRGHVVATLQDRFGKDAVKPGNKAIKILAGNGRRSADVLVSSEFRRYHAYAPPVERYDSGICFFNGAGTRIANYPRQHSDNCTKKHQACAQWFKPMVRILKNMRSKLVNDGVIGRGMAPSYYIEGLLYNVPSDKFGANYASTFTSAIHWIHGADRSKFVCANEQYYLLRDNSETCWPVADGEAFLRAVTDLWNKWR
jgi:hypothetical protein